MRQLKGPVARAIALLVVAAGVGLVLTSGVLRPLRKPAAGTAQALPSQQRAELVFAPEAPLPAPAAVASAPVPAAVAAPPAEDSQSLSALFDSTGLGSAQNFRPRPNGDLPTVTTAFVARDSGGAAFGIEGMLSHGNLFSAHRLTILQLGDSHTAADFFTGRVRERLQELFGTGGAGYIVPGKPHAGVRSAMFKTEASEGWDYDTLQKSPEKQQFYLSGFNAVTRHAGAALNLTARGALGYDSLKVEFLKQPGGGHAQVLIDGALSGEIDLDGTRNERALLSASAPGGGLQAIHDIAVRSTSDAPVTVTGIHVERDGDGVSYLSLGFPGATVQVLQKLLTANLADDMQRVAPDIVVLAFGTNEGFNDVLDIGNYTAEYTQVIARLKKMRPHLRIVMIGPPDGARPPASCKSAAAGRDCTAPVEAGNSPCRFETPPKLAQVRAAQRRIAESTGADFWDWSSVMPGPCGAQAWAAASPALMAHDYVHLTLEGYKQSADRFADFLIPLIKDRLSPNHAVSYN